MEQFEGEFEVFRLLAETGGEEFGPAVGFGGFSGPQRESGLAIAGGLELFGWGGGASGEGDFDGFGEVALEEGGLGQGGGAAETLCWGGGFGGGGDLGGDFGGGGFRFLLAAEVLHGLGEEELGRGGGGGDGFRGGEDLLPIAFGGEDFGQEGFGEVGVDGALAFGGVSAEGVLEADFDIGLGGAWGLGGLDELGAPEVGGAVDDGVAGGELVEKIDGGLDLVEGE